MILTRRGTRAASPLTWSSYIRRYIASRDDEAQSARRHADVWACVNRICKDISMLPIITRAELVDGSKRRLTGPELPALLTQPSGELLMMDWIWQILESWQYRGNAYGLVVDVDRMGYPTQLEIINPDSVRWTDGVPHVDNKPELLFPSGRLWHAPAFTTAGSLIGISPIDRFARTIGIGLKVQKFAGDFFEDGANPSGILTTKQNPGNKATEIKDQFVNLTQGNREPILLPEGSVWTPLQIKPEESQFLDTQRLNTETIARIFGIWPEMVGASMGGTALSYANREQRAQDHQTWGLQYWMTKVEKHISMLLPPHITIKINAAGTQRSDLLGRYQSYKIAAEIGTVLGKPLVSWEEMRDFEDLDQ